MSDQPLVSLVTGTIPGRLDLLVEAMRNIREQTYSNIEHCIVVEGEPPGVDEAESRIMRASIELEPCILTRVTGLGRHWSSFLAASLSAVPFQVAQWMARGEYLCWMADDERFDPDHIEALVDLLESTDSDFVYSRCRVWSVTSTPDDYYEIGTDPPVLGQVTNALYRAELLDYRGFRTHIGSGSDFDQVDGWIEAGARWAMLDRVTMSHRADKQGEGPDYRAQRQILRGHYV